MKKVQAALSEMELEDLKVELGSVSYTGGASPEAVIEAINTKTSFQASVE